MAKAIIRRLVTTLVRLTSSPVPAASAEPAEEAGSMAPVPALPQAGAVEPMERDTTFNPVLLKVGNVKHVLAPGATLMGSLVLNDGGIRLQCRVEGSVVQGNDSLVIIDQDAVINGAVQANYLLVLGEVNGDIKAERIVVGESARINGDITYGKTFGSISGSRIRGQIAEAPRKISQEEMHAITKEQSSDLNVVPFPTLDRADNATDATRAVR